MIVLNSMFHQLIVSVRVYNIFHIFVATSLEGRMSGKHLSMRGVRSELLPTSTVGSTYNKLFETNNVL